MSTIVKRFSDTGASKFISQINNFANNAVTKAMGGAEAACEEVLARVIERSPVSPGDSGHSGRFKGNWRVSDHGPTNQYDLAIRDPEGSATFFEGSEKLKAIDFSTDFDVWIANHAPYAVRLEYGWSNQAPRGMVRITMLEWTQIVREVFIKGGGGFKTPDTF